jgi:hypothetical protein
MNFSAEGVASFAAGVFIALLILFWAKRQRREN